MRAEPDSAQVIEEILENFSEAACEASAAVSGEALPSPRRSC